jgi:hypothetical protein
LACAAAAAAAAVLLLLPQTFQTLKRALLHGSSWLQHVRGWMHRSHCHCCSKPVQPAPVAGINAEQELLWQAC